MNRKATGEWGESPTDIVLARGQFEPWTTRRQQLKDINRNSSLYRTVGNIVDGVAGGSIPDPTNGATYFLNPAIVMARSGRLPDWAQGNPSARIGAHNFYMAPNQPRFASPQDAINHALGLEVPNNSPRGAIYNALGLYRDER